MIIQESIIAHYIPSLGRARIFLNYLCLITMVLLLTVSCAKKQLPLYLENPAKNLKYPISLYITAVGISLASQQDAEMQAKAAIASQIKASLKASSTSVIEEMRKNKKQETTEEFISRITVETDFKNAELIKTDYNSSQKYEDKFYIFAYLKKEELLEIHFKEYDRNSFLFRQYGWQAEEAFKTYDYQLFRNNITEAVNYMAELYKGYFQIRAIMQGVPFEKQPENEKIYYELLRKKASWRDKLSFYLDLKGNYSASKREYWINLFETVFNGYKLKIFPENNCKTKETGSNLLKIVLEEKCTEGSFGPICKLDLKGGLVNCKSESLIFEFDLSSLKLDGSNARDKAKALTMAYGKVDINKIGLIFKEKIKDYFPVE